MAVDKLVDSTQLDADLTSVANAIRTKGGTSAQMAFPAGFVSAVNAIPAGGTSVFGLIREINVDDGVSVITYDLPQTALSYGAVWVELDNVTRSQNDYLYVAVVSSTDTPSDATGYSDSSSINTTVVYLVFQEAKELNGAVYNGFTGMIRSAEFRVNQKYITDPAYKFSRVYFRFYNGNTKFTGGTIRLYGRIA
jgi:hypothetical protein